MGVQRTAPTPGVRSWSLFPDSFLLTCSLEINLMPCPWVFLDQDALETQTQGVRRVHDLNVIMDVEVAWKTEVKPFG